MRWITSPGWPGNLLAVVDGALTTLALAPYDIWPLALVALATLFLARTAKRCAWKAPGQWLLCSQYAVHAHFQKIPALFGQLAWRKAQRQQAELALVDYKESEKIPGELSSSLETMADEGLIIFQNKVIKQLWKKDI